MKLIFLSVTASCLLLAPLAYAAEANPVEPISKVEFSEMQRDIFNKIDTNFNGNLSADEITNSTQSEQRVRLKKQYKELDVNSDGHVTLADITETQAKKYETMMSQMQARNDKYFEVFDLDSNGAITKEEYSQVKEEQWEKSQEHRITGAEKKFLRMDGDENGYVTEDEYVESKLPPSRSNSKRPNTNALRRDTNGDGQITRTENDDFIENLFAKLDKDDDRSLSAAEQRSGLFRMNQRIRPSFMGGIFAPGMIP